MIKQKLKTQQGFTLLELLVVLSIIALLAGVVVPKSIEYLDDSKIKTARLQVEELSAALDMYKLDVGSYPKTDQGLLALVEKPSNGKRWNGPYVRKNKKIPNDPWEQDYTYVSPGEHGKFDLFSLGADGQEGGEGTDQDITSWEE
ncbi:MAG: type II secretion system major pseudopilin GspG [Methylococcales bacterium]|nr:type II secretion system major pseudopilin GspG [Methylococcales bacterium]